MSDVMTQQVIDGAFPEMNERIEKLAAQLIDADAKLVKAQDRKQTAYDALKEEMRANDLSEYHCYQIRYLAKLGEIDPRLSLKPVKANEPTPFRPQSEE